MANGEVEEAENVVLRLGRKIPTDWKHVERFPLSLATAPSTPVPVVLGINWYTNFMSPIKEGIRWWIGRGNLGPVLGGHAICAKSGNLRDYYLWYKFYNQQENSCVGFSCSRMMSLLNRVRYDAPWLYHEALKIDEWPGEADEGTSVRAGCEILRTLGHRKVKKISTDAEALSEGISAYRWATSVDEIHRTLGSSFYDQIGAIPLLNSWGEGYPWKVWLPDEILDQLLQEYGEAAIVTDS